MSLGISSCMAGLAAMFSLALYVYPYFDTMSDLQPEPGLLYVTSALLVAGEIAFV